MVDDGRLDLTNPDFYQFTFFGNYLYSIDIYVKDVFSNLIKVAGYCHKRGNFIYVLIKILDYKEVCYLFYLAREI